MSTLNKLSRGIEKAADVVKPVSEHTARWMLIGLGAFFFFLELDFVFEGALYTSWRWFWQNVIAVHPTVPYWLGVLSYHLVQRHYRKRVRQMYRARTPLPRKTDPLDLGCDALQGEANTMGVDVDIKAIDTEVRAKDAAKVQEQKHE